MIEKYKTLYKMELALAVVEAIRDFDKEVMSNLKVDSEIDVEIYNDVGEMRNKIIGELRRIYLGQDLPVIDSIDQLRNELLNKAG